MPEELKNLVNLRGSLSIFGLNNVSNIDDAKEVKLRKKGFVERLTLNFRCDYEFDINDHDHGINNGTRREFSEELLEILLLLCNHLCVASNLCIGILESSKIPVCIYYTCKVSHKV